MAWTLIMLLRRYMIKTPSTLQRAVHETCWWVAQRGKGRDGIGDGRAPSARACAGDPCSTALLSLRSLPLFGVLTPIQPWQALSWRQQALSWRLQAGFCRQHPRAGMPPCCGHPTARWDFIFGCFCPWGRCLFAWPWDICHGFSFFIAKRLWRGCLQAA